MAIVSRAMPRRRITILGAPGGKEYVLRVRVRARVRAYFTDFLYLTILTSTMSSHVVKVRQPHLCAQLIAYLALSLQSCAVPPPSTSFGSTHSGATTPRTW